MDTGCPPAIAATRRQGTTSGRYVTPSEEARNHARLAISRILRGDADVDVSAFGYEIVPLAESNDLILLREKADHKRGGGAYVVRKGGSSSLVVQAPHTFFDAGTLPLAWELFQRAKARALFINTAHRYKSATPLPDGTHPSDVAHATDSQIGRAHV